MYTSFVMSKIEVSFFFGGGGERKDCLDQYMHSSNATESQHFTW